MTTRPLFMSQCLTALALAAFAGPALWSPGTPPLPSFGVETLSLLVWGLWLGVLPRGTLALCTDRSIWRDDKLLAIIATWLLLAACAAVSVIWAGWPLVIGLRHGAVLLAVVAAFSGGIGLMRKSSVGFSQALSSTAVLPCILFAGLFQGVVAILQYGGIEGWWPPLGKDGRVGGTFAQPNLLGTHLLWAYAALAGQLAGRRIPLAPALACAAILISALALSASRTAALACVILAAWGWLDRRLGGRTRALLLAAPLALGLFWLALNAWEQVGGPPFAGTGLLNKADPTSSRWGLWQQCARLVAQNPWWGVGWGQFNLAWSLTPMPGLPRTAGYTFTHAHNLFVHWAIELGLPLTTALAGLLGFIAVQSIKCLWLARENEPVIRRAALAMVLIVAVHSQLEFPLWWVNVLLPTAFLLGIALAEPLTGCDAEPHSHAGGRLLGPWLMVAAAVFAWVDHRALADVYQPKADSPPLAQRLVLARQSYLFGHFGDRFAATLAPAGSRQTETYGRIVFEVIDSRLLASWARAHAEAGQIDRARFLADRLREFGTESAEQFFAACDREPLNFQCTSTDAPLGFRDFRSPAIRR